MSRHRGVLPIEAVHRMTKAELAAARAEGWLPPMAGGSPALRDKLKEIEGQITTLSTERGEKQKALDEAKQKFADSGEDPSDPEHSPLFKAAKDARGEYGVVVDRINNLTDSQVEILKMLGEDTTHRNGDNDDDNGRRSRKSDDGPREGEWDSGALFTDEVMDRFKSLASSRASIGNIHLGQIASREGTRDALKAAGDVDASAGMRRGPWYGVVPQPRRQLRVLDKLPVGTMSGNSFPYTQEAGVLTGALETVEGTVKPPAALTLTDASADAKTIAAWVKVKKQALADQDALRSIIDSRLRFAVPLRLESQVISGDGTGENIRGIRSTSGIGTVTYAEVTEAGANTADRILYGITKILLANGQADGVVLHPQDWQGILTGKGTDGHYISGGPFSTTPQSLWGVELIPTAAMSAGYSLVGDYAMGAQVFVREGVQVLVSDADGNDFTMNRVTVLGEGRFALAVWVPTFFTEVDIAA